MGGGKEWAETFLIVSPLDYCPVWSETLSYLRAIQV